MAKFFFFFSLKGKVVLIETQHRIQIKNGFNLLSCLNSVCAPFVPMKILNSRL